MRKLTWSGGCAWDSRKVCCGSHDCGFVCDLVLAVLKYIASEVCWWKAVEWVYQILSPRHDEINFELVDARCAKPSIRRVKMAGKPTPGRNVTVPRAKK